MTEWQVAKQQSLYKTEKIVSLVRVRDKQGEIEHKTTGVHQRTSERVQMRVRVRKCGCYHPEP